MADKNLSYNNQQQVRPSFGGLTYGSIRPEFVGQPVEDINKSRDILQQRSDVNKNAYMDLNKTYGSLVNQVDNSELGYLSNFDAKLNSNIQDRIAKGEYEYIGVDLANSASKLVSDQGLQKRLLNKQAHNITLNAIDKSDYNWDEKVKMKAFMPYQPISAEEDATNTYKDKAYRVPIDQVNVSKEFMDAFKNLQSNVNGSESKYFIKRGAQANAHRGYNDKDLTMNFEESNGTGLTYDTKSHTSETTSDRVKLLFKSLTDPNINPKTADYLRFKYELANRKPNETKEQFDSRVDPRAYAKYLSDSSDLLAEQLANKQHVGEASVGFITGLAKVGANTGTNVEVTSYQGGISTTNPLSTVEASNKNAQETVANNDRLIAEHQQLLGVPTKDIKTSEDILTKFNTTGEGIIQQIPNAKGDNTIAPQIANTIVQNLDKQSLVKDRNKTSDEAAYSALLAKGVPKSELDKIQEYVKGLATETTTPVEKYLTNEEKMRKGISSNTPLPIPFMESAQKALDYYGAKFMVGLKNIVNPSVAEQFKQEKDKWYENNSSYTGDSHIISLPMLQGEKAKITEAEMGSRITPNLINNADGNDVFEKKPDGTITPLGTDKFGGNIVKREILGYDPAPRGPKGERHWAVNLTLKDSNNKLTTKEMLIPMNMLNTTTMNMVLGDPRVRAADLINSIGINGISKREIPGVPGVVIRSTPNVGTVLDIGNGKKLITDPNEIQITIANILQAQQNELINGKNKTE